MPLLSAMAYKVCLSSSLIITYQLNLSLFLSVFLMIIALGAYGRAFTGERPGHSSWSYTVGWVACLLALLSALYFLLTAVCRVKLSGTGAGRVKGKDQPYTPLAQFEESTETEDGDSADDL